MTEEIKRGNYEDVSFEEFFELLAKADMIRDFAINDIQAGVMKAINEVFGEE